MTHLLRRRTDRHDEELLPDYDLGAEINPRAAEMYATAAGFYAACIKNRYFDEATEFAEWFLETFDIDLEN